MSKVVCRISKISTIQKIGEAGAHNFRLDGEAQREHLKAGVENPLLFGTTDLVSDVQKRLDEAHKCAHGEFRKNAVLAVEMVLSASPEYFKDQACLDIWVKKNMEWLKKEYGKNLVNAVLHLDEQTPHIQAFIVPLDKKNKLNCRSIFGGVKNMVALQTKSFEAVKSLGIERGEPKDITGVTHKTTAQWRKEMQEMDVEKTSFQKSIEEVPCITSNITGLVTAKKADEYYKKAMLDAVKKTYAPKMIKASKDALKLKAENKKLKKLNEEIQKEIKETRKRNFDLQQEFDEIKEKAFKDGYNESQKEYKENQEKLDSEKQKKLFKYKVKKDSDLKL